MMFCEKSAPRFFPTGQQPPAFHTTFYHSRMERTLELSLE